MNMHVLCFEPGGCHPFVETHVQEHGAYILNGEGMYLMDNTWMGIKKEDFMWFGPYVPQCAYGVGTENFVYIYSKDCNRDVSL
jgi:(S)-ureidoglycine aminohydrolase